MTDDTRLKALLHTDALLEAEKVTGKSYKEDKGTEALGFGLHMALGEAKQQALQEARDTYFQMDLEGVLAVYDRLGFRRVYLEHFQGKGWGDDLVDETYRVLWQPEKGILATVDSWQSSGVNMHKVYFNADMGESGWPDRCSGGFSRTAYDRGERIYAGDRDVREGLALFIRDTEEQGGRFLPQWIERPFCFWLLHHGENRLEGSHEDVVASYEASTARKVSEFPLEVQEAITP